jgi:hypothetical protein
VSHSSVRKSSGATAAGRPSGTTAGVYMRVMSVEARCIGNKRVGEVSKRTYFIA